MFDNELITGYVHSATADVFGTMLGLDIETLPTRMEGSDPSVDDGVLAFVGMAGPWTGAGAITCTAEFARTICQALLGTEADSVNEEVLDALGEVTNMIIGGFKTLIEQHTGLLGLSIPTVVYGRNFTSHSTGRNEWVVAPFRCGGQKMEVRVCLKQSRESSHSVRGGFSQSASILN
jgi:chemotaxis protein CheX